MFLRVQHCRICNSSDLEQYLDLGKLPLANNLVPVNKQDADPCFPLQVQRCTNCQLSQLSVVVQPEILFSEYAYRTSISSTFRRHFEDMGKELAQKFRATKKPIVLDIGSNDGCLLEGFKKHGFIPLGVEPAGNLALIANEKGIKTIHAFWDDATAARVIKEQGNVHVVTATNVFAHVHDVHGFVRNVKRVLHAEGLFVVEAPHALNLIQKNEFDTVYHEHLSYFLVKPLLTLFEMEGMEVCDVQSVSTHGGSLRVFVKNRESSIPVERETIKAYLKEEEAAGLYGEKAYRGFAARTEHVKKSFIDMVQGFLREGKTVAGYAASAKASTLLNYCGLGKKEITFIVDDALEKQGKTFAGNRIPIVPNQALEKEKPDVLIVFAWNIAREIIEKTREHQQRGGIYVIPMPFPRIIKSEKEL